MLFAVSPTRFLSVGLQPILHKIKIASMLLYDDAVIMGVFIDRSRGFFLAFACSKARTQLGEFPRAAKCKALVYLFDVTAVTCLQKFIL